MGMLAEFTATTGFVDTAPANAVTAKSAAATGMPKGDASR
jgi:hypothetical protein